MIPSVISVSKSGKEGLDLLSYEFIKNRTVESAASGVIHDVAIGIALI